MRDPISATLGAIERDLGGVAIVWCPDLDLRGWLVAEVESLVSSDRRPLRVSSLDKALDEPDRLALWEPVDEEEAVLELEGGRDRLRNPALPRSQPVVLFLLRHGDGARTMAEQAISLASIVSGNDVDPESLTEIDVDAEREGFRAETGKTPEEWLTSWNKQELAPTSHNFAVSYRAKLLERP